MRKPLLFVLGVIVVLAGFNTTHVLFRDAGFNTAVILAQSFLDGRLDVTPPDPPIDLIEHEGRYYVPFPPATALLMTPFVLLFGRAFSPLWITPLLGGLTAGMLFLLYRRFTRDDTLSYGLSAAMILGTAYWLCVRYAFDTYLAHMVTVLVISIALWECLGRKRGWLVGLCLGIACTSRQLTVGVVPFAFAMLLFPAAGEDHQPLMQRLRPIISATAILALFLGALLWYNYARFGSPFDSGYDRVYEEGWYAYRLDRWGNFNWRYIPSNILRFFVMGFAIDFQPPNFMTPVMSRWGTSLTVASPFVLYGFLKGPSRLSPLATATGYACTGMILLALLMHKSAGGGWQINGIRYTLDFLPMWSLFIARGMQRFPDGAGLKLRHAAIGYAIALNALAIVITHTRHFFPH